MKWMSLVLLVMLLLAPQIASACPGCAAGVQARGEVWSQDFAKNLAFCTLPFLVIAALCVRVERLGRPQGASRGQVKS